MGTKLRFWRWRRNPLRRRSDVAEAWTVLVTGVLLAVGAPAVGVAVGMDTEAASARQGQDWHRTDAVVVKDAPRSGYLDRARTDVRWTAADGTSRKGRALVQVDSRAGSRTTIWLDDEGTLRDPPPTKGQTTAEGALLGAVSTIVTATFVAAGGWIVRGRLDRHREAQWDREWASVGPRWGRRPA
ncbi:hypothetical protein ACJWDR_01850 [Streptomyces tauricus]|uniref:Rv1733c family protein n=1 Tax=Streptomyces tauricus TaxID=68274 RepID=UPI00387F164E